MKRLIGFTLTIMMAVLATGCRLDNHSSNTGSEVCKLTYGSAHLEETSDGWQRYAVTLHRDASATSTAGYAGSAVTLRLDLITAVQSDRTLASGDYSLSATKTPYAIISGDGSAVCITTSSSYGEEFTRLSQAAVTVASFGATYQISGTIATDTGINMEFSYFGELDVEGAPEPDQPQEPAVTIDFETAVLGSSSQYTNILWGREVAEEFADGSMEYNGLLYSEAGASFGSYYSFDGAWEMWGGFAISSNRNLDDLGYDYSNQFSVYAPDASQFALGYVFGEWGGSYANPVVEFAEPVSILSADIANANKTYHYCISNPTVGFDDERQPIWVKLVIEGFDAQGVQTGQVTCTLADEGRVLDDWTNVDLSALGQVARLTFDITSNDIGEYGLNVPAFFCIDNIVCR